MTNFEVLFIIGTFLIITECYINLIIILQLIADSIMQYQKNIFSIEWYLVDLLSLQPLSQILPNFLN